jgi:hypothetical protein
MLNTGQSFRKGKKTLSNLKLNGVKLGSLNEFKANERVVQCSEVYLGNV